MIRSAVMKVWEVRGEQFNTNELRPYLSKVWIRCGLHVNPVQFIRISLCQMELPLIGRRRCASVLT
jgi:hypothetical protein